jgi:hypothetical protein
MHASRGANLYFKLPSTPADPSIAIVDGHAQIIALHGIAPDAISYIGHGTTVATNMIIEGRGVPTGLVTTRGFRDVLAIGRQTRPALYDTAIRKPAPLVERYRRREVDERLDAKGECLRALDRAELEAVLDELAETGVQSPAARVCPTSPSSRRCSSTARSSPSPRISAIIRMWVARCPTRSRRNRARSSRRGCASPSCASPAPASWMRIWCG